MERMKGKDLIKYIQDHNLENEPIYTENGILVGWMTEEEAAEKWKVQPFDIRTWVNTGELEGVRSNDNLIVPIISTCPKKEGEANERDRLSQFIFHG